MNRQERERLPIDPRSARLRFYPESDHGAAVFADGRGLFKGHIFMHIGNVGKDLNKAKEVAKDKSNEFGATVVIGVGIDHWESIINGQRRFNHQSLGSWRQII